MRDGVHFKWFLIMSVRLFFSFFLFNFFSFFIFAQIPFKQLTFFSDRQKLDLAGNVICTGNVLAVLDNRWKVWAPLFEFDYQLKKGDFRSTEDEAVRGIIEKVVWQAEAAAFDIDQKKMTVQHIEASRERLRFVAQEAIWEPEKEVVFTEVFCTTCKKKEPHWQLSSHRFLLGVDKKIRSAGVYFTSGRLKIPLPLSFFSFSFGVESGFLIPRFYWDRIGGCGVKQRYYQKGDLVNQIFGLHWLEKKGMILSDQIKLSKKLDHLYGELYCGYGALWQASSHDLPINRSWMPWGQVLGEVGYEHSIADVEVQWCACATENKKEITKKSTQWLFEKSNEVDLERSYKSILQIKKTPHQFSVFSDYTSYQSMQQRDNVKINEWLDRSEFELGRLLHAEYRSEGLFAARYFTFDHRAFVDVVLSSSSVSSWKNQKIYYQKKESSESATACTGRFLYQGRSVFRLSEEIVAPWLAIEPSFFIGQKYESAIKASRIIPSLFCNVEIPLPSMQHRFNRGCAQSKTVFIWEACRVKKEPAYFYGVDRYDQFFEKDFFGIKQQAFFFYKEYGLGVQVEGGIDLTDEAQKNPLTRGVTEGLLFPLKAQVDLWGDSVGCSLKMEGALEQGALKPYQLTPFFWGKWSKVHLEAGYIFQSADLAQRRLLFELGSALFLDSRLFLIPELEVSYHLVHQLSFKKQGLINQVFRCLWKFDCWQCGIRFEQERTPFLGKMINEWKIGFDFRFIFHD